MKASPPLSRFSTVIIARCASAMRRTIESPEYRSHSEPDLGGGGPSREAPPITLVGPLPKRWFQIESWPVERSDEFDERYQSIQQRSNSRSSMRLYRQRRWKGSAVHFHPVTRNAPHDLIRLGILSALVRRDTGG